MSGRDIEELADVPGGGFKRLLEIRDLDRVQRAESGPAGRDRTGDAQQPVQRERESLFFPSVQVSAHNCTRLGPVSAFLGKREIPFGQFCPARIDQVEDIDHYIDALILAGELFLVKIPLKHLPQPGQVADVGNDPRPGGGVGVQHPHLRLKAPREQRRDIDPARVIGHLGRRVELEGLVLHMEPEPGEYPFIPLEEGGRAPAGDPVQGGDPLLPVQDKDPEGGGCLGLFAADERAVGPRLPGQQAADRVTEVQGPHEPADLVSVPYVAALELG